MVLHRVLYPHPTSLPSLLQEHSCHRQRRHHRSLWCISLEKNGFWLVGLPKLLKLAMGAEGMQGSESSSVPALQPLQQCGGDVEDAGRKPALSPGLVREGVA